VQHSPLALFQKGFLAALHPACGGHHRRLLGKSPVTLLNCDVMMTISSFLPDVDSLPNSDLLRLGKSGNGAASEQLGLRLAAGSHGLKRNCLKSQEMFAFSSSLLQQPGPGRSGAPGGQPGSGCDAERQTLSDSAVVEMAWFGAGCQKQRLQATHAQASRLVPVLSRLAESGVAEAQFRLGRFYMGGIGVDEDKAVSASYFLESAQRGHAAGMYHAGRCLVRGEGVDTDEERGYALWEQAALLGHAHAKKKMEPPAGLTRRLTL
jgi:hypothetical protein